MRASLAAARALHEAGWEVGIGSPTRRGLAASSRSASRWHYVPALPDGPRRFLEAVATAERIGRYEVVFAAGDAELLALSSDREALPVCVPFAPHATVLRALDKLQLAQAAGAVGMATPLNVMTQRGATVGHLRQGRVVICDRYTLDSLVHLRSEYGDHRFRLQRLLVRRLSPKPSLAYFLEVRPQTALERKAEEFSPADLERHSRLYREEYAALGVHRLDGESPRAELCAEVAREVWEKLNG